MNCFRLICLGLGLGLAGLAHADLTVSPPAPGTTTNQFRPADRSTVANLIPPAPQAISPVAMFRRVLSMSPRDRESFLTNRPPEMRTALRAKIQEYLAMDPDDRELRLRATELRYQLVPLLRLKPADRGPRLAMVPDDLAPLVTSRLADWDQLSTNLQQEFLANDHTLHYFSHVETATPASGDNAAAAQLKPQAIGCFFDEFDKHDPTTAKMLSGPAC